MANGHGGYRKPTNPAPVSGPGAHSKRTDGKQPKMALTGGNYGDGTDFNQIQSGAPLAQTSQTPAPAQPVQGGQVQGPLAGQSFTPLSAPSTQPGTPVTDGAASGPGAGVEAIGGQPNDQQNDAQYLQRYLPTLIRIAEADDTPPGVKRFVRSIVANK
jgi:hypothetical protein